MIKIQKAILLSNLEIQLDDVLKSIKKHEGIINSLKADDSFKKNSKFKLKKLIEERQRLSDLIVETMFLKE